MPYEWTYEVNQILSIVLSDGEWKYTDIETTGTNRREIYADYTVNTTDGFVTCTGAIEIRKIPLSDSNIEELQGADADEELEYLAGSYTSYEPFCDFNAKVLCLKKTIANDFSSLRGVTDHNRPLPLACMTTPTIKVDSITNPTKYKVDDGYGSYRYYVKY